MKTIAQLSGTDFLRRCNQIRHAVENVLKKTAVMEIRKQRPPLTGEETEEERRRLEAEQAKKNLDAMLDRMLEEQPEETEKLLRLFVQTEKGEQEPTGLEMAMAGLSVLSDQRVIDFLSSLMRLGQSATGA